MPSRKLDDLDPIFRPRAFEFLARLTEATIPVLIINTGRTAAEQAEYLRTGASWVQRSKHQDGLAIDICPWEIFQLRGPDKLEWDADDPIWTKIGAIGEKLGLVWGGRWKKRDMGHFEMPAAPAKKPAATT